MSDELLKHDLSEEDITRIIHELTGQIYTHSLHPLICAREKRAGSKIWAKSFLMAFISLCLIPLMMVSLIGIVTIGESRSSLRSRKRLHCILSTTG